MPKYSKKTAPHVEDAGVMIGRYGELDEYTVGFEHFREDADGTPLFRGLPDDRCQSAHWGYVIIGQRHLPVRGSRRDLRDRRRLLRAPGSHPGHHRRNGDRRVQPDRGLSPDDGRRRREPRGARQRLTLPRQGAGPNGPCLARVRTRPRSPRCGRPPARAGREPTGPNPPRTPRRPPVRDSESTS